MPTKPALAARRSQRAPATPKFFRVDPHAGQSTLSLDRFHFTTRLRAHA
ncbi:hypothetical protein [Aromatoleum petrolei]|uniref:Uncharacterized protein n=1 Tax=Aromatoleum petrolei TaxID=76116 RepID=A0ABX1MT78_9RHOO|nr:hypothetical protein [Aromatoleum petrolei]NMF91174.1 hypothetical protein [Aromatoleum petrolei]QTQ34568.1 Uncharacterized protein ToN1_03930 [Aromatoleum petrolei]